MTAPRALCPYCGKRVALRSFPNKLRAHSCPHGAWCVTPASWTRRRRRASRCVECFKARQLTLALYEADDPAAVRRAPSAPRDGAAVPSQRAQRSPARPAARPRRHDARGAPLGHALEPRRRAAAPPADARARDARARCRDVRSPRRPLRSHAIPRVRSWIQGPARELRARSSTTSTCRRSPRGSPAWPGLGAVDDGSRVAHAARRRAVRRRAGPGRPLPVGLVAAVDADSWAGLAGGNVRALREACRTAEERDRPSPRPSTSPRSSGARSAWRRTSACGPRTRAPGVVGPRSGGSVRGRARQQGHAAGAAAAAAARVGAARAAGRAPRGGRAARPSRARVPVPPDLEAGPSPLRRQGAHVRQLRAAVVRAASHTPSSGARTA